ncbi:WXG100 family type VII secretion target [Nocardia transvalensis]|uniref:ESAT-6-like protein n=1 Tax=Nocardia transvalensis TaxID=37333 RepID=A0A7W9PM08_9NOCA|nr:WXG100 family type VII secretion target [Nocardia transvalensis]MBB5918492.1 WXG100 family type VII secretion target [Nocardia transvalensis]
MQVDPARLREAAAYIGGKARYLGEKIAELDRTVGRELLADGWQGRSASAYDESWLEWKAGADAIVEALEQSASDLAATATLYEAQDERNSDSIAQAGGEQRT